MLDRINPSVIRLYDEHESIKQIKSLLGIDLTSGCYMVIGLDGTLEQVNLDERRIIQISNAHHGKLLPAHKAWNWWNRKYTFQYPKHNIDFPYMFGTLDTLCTFENIENLYYSKKTFLRKNIKTGV